MFISVGMGLGFGIIAGLLTFCTNPLLATEYFEDGYYWRMPDGIRTVYSRKAVAIYQAPEPAPTHVVVSAR